MKTNIQNRKGFTIVELVITLAILGVLAWFIVPQFMVEEEDAYTLRENNKSVELSADIAISEMKALPPATGKDLKKYKEILDEKLSEKYSGNYKVTIQNGHSQIEITNNEIEGNDLAVFKPSATVLSVENNGCVYSKSTRSYTGTCQTLPEKTGDE